MAERTWFSTLTIRPDWRIFVLSAARAEASRQGSDFDALDDRERFRRLCKQVSIELTLFMKRVRKNSGARFKYLAVFEAHASGDPHLHLLIHERDPALPVRERVLSKAWRWGFSKHRLIERDPRAASYVCKYLTKSADARVRASLRYGSFSGTEKEERPEFVPMAKSEGERDLQKAILAFVTDEGRSDE